jgi:hypothetical protein
MSYVWYTPSIECSKLENTVLIDKTHKWDPYSQCSENNIILPLGHLKPRLNGIPFVDNLSRS